MSSDIRTIMLCIVLSLFSYSSGYGQNDYGKVWVQGAAISYTSTFEDGDVTNQLFDTWYNPGFFHGHSNICDSVGNLLLACTGYMVFDNIPEVLENGDSLVPSLLYQHYEGVSTYPQSSIILPVEGNKYYVVTPTASNKELSTYWWSNPNAGRALFDLLLYHEVDMNWNNGAGRVVRKKVPLLEDVQLSKTQMMACRHGDGKSWWLLKQAHDTNRVYKFLFTRDSVYGPYIQGFAEPHFTKWDITGQSVFTQDGTLYATSCMGAGKVFLADFDRCSGDLSSPKVINVPSKWTNNPYDSTEMEPWIEGLAFSPNGRFLYVAKRFNILQYDLQASDSTTAWSHIAGLDTSWAAFQTYSSMYLGPDNKLYIGNWNGLSSQMSVINEPDNKGADCQFCPRCLRFPKFKFSSSVIGGGVTSPPCMPNYKLGASNPPCGGYPVDTTATVPIGFNVFPNPTTGEVTVQYQMNGDENVYFKVVDVLGRTVSDARLDPSLTSQSIDLGNHATGTYYYRLMVNGTQKATGKLILVNE